jgi:hypothetical protein
VNRLASTVLARRPWLARAEISYGFTAAAPAPGPSALAERLIAAYHRAAADAPRGPGAKDMWAVIGENFQGDLVSLAEAGKAAELAEYLRRLPMLPAGHGFAQGEASYQALSASPEAQRERGFWLMDHLAGMAEAAGVLDVRCPEQGPWEEPPPCATPAALRDGIEARAGVPISLPESFEGLFVLEPGERPVHLRTVMGGYVAWKAASFARSLLAAEVAELRVGEIGAGIGYSAFAAYQLGVRNYEIYDLAPVNLVQGYFLLRSLPEGAVSLYGEAAAPVRVLPAFAYDDAPPGAFHVVVNVDSLPEVSPAEAARYARRLGEVTELFFSINQEARAPQVPGQAQLAVREVLSGKRELARYPNWVRAGYVDELWATKSPTRSP